LRPNFQIKFQQYDDNQIPTDGRAYDHIQVVASVPDEADYYRFTLSAGEQAALAITGTAVGNLGLELLDSGGGHRAWGGDGSTTLTKAISSFVDPAGGTFYARVTSDANVPYNLVITQNAVLESEDNDTFDTAQAMDNVAGAFGAISSGVVPSSLTKVDGNSDTPNPFNLDAGNPMRYQQLYSRTDFSQPGKITAIRFRRNGNTA